MARPKRPRSQPPARGRKVSDRVPGGPEPIRGPRSVFDRPAAFWGSAVLLLSVLSALLVYTARAETATFDEPTHLAAGYNIVTTGDYWYNYEHPPLMKLLAGLALWPLDPRLPREIADWGHTQRTGMFFVYRNRVPPDTMVFRARLPFVALTVVFGLAFVLWLRAHLGALAALLGLAFYTLDPSVISHGHYVTSDMPAAIFVFLSVVCWENYLRRGGWMRSLLAGIVLGLALSAKFSTILLVALLPLVGLIHAWQHQGRWRRALGGVPVVFAGGIMVLGLTYYPDTLRALENQGPRLHAVVDPSHPAGRAFAEVGRMLDLPAHPYLVGLHFVARHNEEGHFTYLLGQPSRHGCWYYFPVAFLVKTPTALLAALALAVAGLVRGWVRRGRPSPRKWPPVVFLLGVPAVVFFALAMQSNLNLGLRHILPVYPFAFAAAGGALAHCWRRPALTVAMLALLAAEHVWVAPHYLAFFNAPSGGPTNGPRYLLDSNIDWGQDVGKLRDYVHRTGAKPLCVALMGVADEAYYGVKGRYVPTTESVAKYGRPDCVVAISVSWLYELFAEPGTFAWLRELQPDERIGYSIYVYDLRRPKRAGI